MRCKSGTKTGKSRKIIKRLPITVKETQGWKTSLCFLFLCGCNWFVEKELADWWADWRISFADDIFAEPPGIRAAERFSQIHIFCEIYMGNLPGETFRDRLMTDGSGMRISQDQSACPEKSEVVPGRMVVRSFFPRLHGVFVPA